jgi:hypothetical protein
VRKVGELDPTGSTPTSEWATRQLPSPTGNPALDAAVQEGRRLVELLHQEAEALTSYAVAAIRAGYPVSDFDLETADCGLCATWDQYIRRHCIVPGFDDDGVPS